MSRRRQRRLRLRLDFYDGMSLAQAYQQQMDVLLDCMADSQHASRQPLLLEVARSLTSYYGGHLQDFVDKARRHLPAGS